jgi:hypothetical protein
MRTDVNRPFAPTFRCLGGKAVSFSFWLPGAQRTKENLHLPHVGVCQPPVWLVLKVQ